MTILDIAIRIRIIIDIVICMFCGSIRSIAISPAANPDCPD
ncbi:2965_t:CDS:2 [Dentiscutata heterogama]|uniref:2965_t:CDS:1 n=1 Tax=Dentiscutata heterogama TaxID=1316150 RepID=A0ACA9KKU6_9GLOM|nr:2965_t:CDS:2 [Dentiscutata heterogama]